MTDGVAEELVLKVGVKVDNSEYIDLKEDLKKNRQESINLKVKPDERILPANEDAIRTRLANTTSKSIPINEKDINIVKQKSKVFPINEEAIKDRLENKNYKKEPISEKDILTSNLKDSKKYLTDIVNSKEDGTKSSLSKDKAQEYLSKILEVEKKSSNSLENLISKESEIQQENKKKIESESIGGFGIAGIIAGVFGAAFYAQKQVLNMYTEKLTRELDVANLAAATGETADNMTKLNYQAKNVGLSLDQVVHSAGNFATDIFSGKDQEKTAIFAALGINPVEAMRNIKTPEDAIKYQIKIFEETKEGYKRGGYPEFIATTKAANLAGIPQNQILGYENFESQKNKKLALETKGFRGEVGSKESIMGNFEDLTSTLQNSTASMDQLLSRGDIAKKISLQSADITAKTVNLINATLNLTGLGDKNSKFSQIMSSEGNQYKLPNFSSKGPSSTAQAKSGG
jgi:hypothetical protein